MRHSLVEVPLQLFPIHRKSFICTNTCNVFDQIGEEELAGSAAERRALETAADQPEVLGLVQAGEEFHEGDELLGTFGCWITGMGNGQGLIERLLHNF